MMKKTLAILALAFAAFVGLRHYLIIKPVEYPINRDQGWNYGDVAHILPTVNHQRFLIKVSFLKPLAEVPVLKVGGASIVKGAKTDSEGRFWMFDAGGLNPDTEYLLSMTDGKGAALCDPWPLRTFPHPEANPKRLRLLIST